MYERIIEIENLNCTPEEFETFLNSIDLSEIENELNTIQPVIHSFDELYNWSAIDNPASGELYYTVEVWGRVFLQNIVPYVSGNLPITNENVQTVFSEHKTQLINDYLISERIRLTILNFK